jgi:hypothetical protein
MITRFNPPFRSEVPPQWRGACATVAGGGPNRATAIIVARLVFTISGPSRAFTALRLIDLVTATHSHMNELATLEFGLQQLARLEDELAPDGAVPGPLMLALSSRTRIGTVERANTIAASTLSAEAQRRLTVLPIEITTGYRRPDGQWPPRCPVAWLVHEFNARVASHVETPDPHDRRLGPDQFVGGGDTLEPATPSFERWCSTKLSPRAYSCAQPDGWRNRLIFCVGRLLPHLFLFRFAVNRQFGMPFDERGSILGQALPGGGHFEQLVPLLACHALRQRVALFGVTAVL